MTIPKPTILIFSFTIQIGISKINRAKRSINFYYRTITVTPSTAEEEERNYQLAVRLLLYSHYATGGFYTARKIPKGLKYALYAFNLIGCSILTVNGNLYYIINFLSGSIPFDFLEIITLVSPFAAFSLHFFWFPILKVYFRSSIQNTFTCLSAFKTNYQKINLEFENVYSLGKLNCKEGDIRSIKNIFKKRNLLLIPVTICTMSIAGIMFALLSPTLNYVLFFKDDRLPTILDYVVLPPFYDRIHSIQVYYCISGVTLFFGVFASSCLMTSYFFLELLSNIMYNNAIDICEKINIVSRNFTHHFEILLMDEKRNNLDEAASKDRLISAFEKDLRTLIIEYEKCNE